MGSELVRARISQKNKYYISKHRYYELKHYCLQYNEWKKAYNDLAHGKYPSGILIFENGITLEPLDNTAYIAEKMASYSLRMRHIETVCKSTDEELADYILQAVTNDLSYTNLSTKYGIPCGKDMYYDRYRKFFWLLDMELQFA